MAGTYDDEYTPVPLTAEALEALRGGTDGPEEDEDFGYVARMLDHGMWNMDGVAMDFGRREEQEDVRDGIFKLPGGEDGSEMTGMVDGVGNWRTTTDDDDDFHSGKQNDDEHACSGSGGDDDDAAYAEVGGSFIAYIAAKYGPPSASRAAQLAMRTIAAELDCSSVHAVDTRGFVAHESSGVTTHVFPDSCTVMFVGHLENRVSLAENCDLPANCTCAELVHKLYNDCGTSFLNQLAGFFAFVLVDADTSTVFAAVDRHGSIPLYKGRSKGGGVFVVHPARSSDRGLVRALGEMNKIPAGSYVHGNRHIIPHKYARSAESERVLLEMERRASQQSLLIEDHQSNNHDWQLVGGGAGEDACPVSPTTETHSVLSAGGASTRSLLGLVAEGGGGGGDNVVVGGGSRSVISSMGPSSPPDASLRRGAAAAALWLQRQDSARDVHHGGHGHGHGHGGDGGLQGWNSMTRSWSSSANVGRVPFSSDPLYHTDSDDAEECVEPESRMGTLFRTRSFTLQCDARAGSASDLVQNSLRLFSSFSSQNHHHHHQQQQQQQQQQQHRLRRSSREEDDADTTDYDYPRRSRVGRMSNCSGRLSNSSVAAADAVAAPEICRDDVPAPPPLASDSLNPRGVGDEADTSWTSSSSKKKKKKKNPPRLNKQNTTTQTRPVMRRVHSEGHLKEQVMLWSSNHRPHHDHEGEGWITNKNKDGGGGGCVSAVSVSVPVPSTPGRIDVGAFKVEEKRRCPWGSAVSSSEGDVECGGGGDGGRRDGTTTAAKIRRSVSTGALFDSLVSSSSLSSSDTSTCFVSLFDTSSSCSRPLMEEPHKIAPVCV